MSGKRRIIAESSVLTEKHWRTAALTRGESGKEEKKKNNNAKALWSCLTSYICMIHWNWRLPILTMAWRRSSHREVRIGTGEVVGRRRK